MREPQATVLMDWNGTNRIETLGFEGFFVVGGKVGAEVNTSHEDNETINSLRIGNTKGDSVHGVQRKTRAIERTGVRSH